MKENQQRLDLAEYGEWMINSISIRPTKSRLREVENLDRDIDDLIKKDSHTLPLGLIRWRNFLALSLGLEQKTWTI